MKREDAAENFLADESSSDENIDSNIGMGGIFFWILDFFVLIILWLF